MAAVLHGIPGREREQRRERLERELGENEGEGEGEGIAWVLGGYACERLWVAVNEGASERG